MKCVKRVPVVRIDREAREYSSDKNDDHNDRVNSIPPYNNYNERPNLPKSHVFWVFRPC